MSVEVIHTLSRRSRLAFLTLWFSRNFGLPTYAKRTPLPLYSLRSDNLSPAVFLCFPRCVVQILFSVEYILVAARVRKRKPFAPLGGLPCPPPVLPSVALQPFTGGGSTPTRL